MADVDNDKVLKTVGLRKLIEKIKDKFLGIYTKEEITDILNDYPTNDEMTHAIRMGTEIVYVNSTSGQESWNHEKTYYVNTSTGFDVYVYDNNAWSKKGSVSVDTSNLVKKSGDTMTGGLNINTTSSESKVDLRTENGNQTIVRLCQPGNNTNRLTLDYQRDGVRGLWDNRINEYVVGIDNNNNVTFKGKADDSVKADTAKAVKGSSSDSISYVTGDTHVLQLGYITIPTTYSSIELMVNHGFYNNQHYGSDLLHIFAHRPSSGGQSGNNNVVVTRTVLSAQDLNGQSRTYYALLDNANNRLYIYAEINANYGNGYGTWNVTPIGNNVDFNAVFAGNVDKSRLSEIPITGHVYHAEYAEVASAASNANLKKTVNLNGDILQIGTGDPVQILNASRASTAGSDVSGNPFVTTYLKTNNQPKLLTPVNSNEYNYNEDAEFKAGRDLVGYWNARLNRVTIDGYVMVTYKNINDNGLIKIFIRNAYSASNITTYYEYDLYAKGDGTATTPFKLTFDEGVNNVSLNILVQVTSNSGKYRVMIGGLYMSYRAEGILNG